MGWKELRDTDLRTAFSTSAEMPSVTVAHENECRTRCSEYDEEQCIGYTITRSSSTSECTFFDNVTAASDVDNAESGICLRGLMFQTHPGECWAKEACNHPPVVAVPPEFGNSKVTLRTVDILAKHPESTATPTIS